MKIFWAILGILIACGVAYVVIAPGEGSRDSTLASGVASSPKAPTAAAVREGFNSPVAPSVKPEADRASSVPVQSSATTPASKPPSLPPLGYPHPDSIADALVSGDWSNVELPGARPASAASPTATPSTPATGTPSTAAGSAEAAAKPTDTKKAYEVAKGTIAKNADGSLLIDGRITVKGSGTEADPYVVPWELLTSAETTFNPRQAMRKIPEGVALLDGKRVRISSNVAFPLYIQQPTEVLAMLNQWDGCCIGVPPTPYDAIEVRLAKPVKGNDRFATSGVVEGTFSVKPYVTGNWLVGLYVIESGALVPGEFGAAPTTHGQ